MKPIQNWGRKWWLEAELSSSPAVQSVILPRLVQAKNAARTLLKPYVDVYQWQGETQAGSLRVIYAGLGSSNQFLKELIFNQEPAERFLGRLTYTRLSELVNAAESDLTIVHADKNLIDRLPRRNSVRLPQFVTWMMNVQGSAEELRLRIPKNMRKDVLRLTREHGYEYEVSHSKEDFDHFYYEMYLPSMRHLHGELTDPTSYTEAYQYFKHGWLYKISREGEYICGRLVYVKEDVVYLKLIGLKGTYLELRREGIHHATTYPILQDVNKQGFKFVNLGLTAPFSNINLFQHKRRWGASIAVVPFDTFQFWIHFHRVTPAVTQFMLNNPLVCLDEGGDLYGLMVVGNPTNLDEINLERQRHLYLVSGMKDLQICAIGDLITAPVSKSEIQQVA